MIVHGYRDAIRFGKHLMICGTVGYSYRGSELNTSRICSLNSASFLWEELITCLRKRATWDPSCSKLLRPLSNTNEHQLSFQQWACSLQETEIWIDTSTSLPRLQQGGDDLQMFVQSIRRCIMREMNANTFCVQTSINPGLNSYLHLQHHVYLYAAMLPPMMETSELKMLSSLQKGAVVYDDDLELKWFLLLQGSWSDFGGFLVLFSSESLCRQVCLRAFLAAQLTLLEFDSKNLAIAALDLNDSLPFMESTQ
ncbi:uncharacterized protein [Alexandromys fortis]|uniref:uncharacterized protein n=1 Tax=Alexandromys fortis TaxID=100897 RepID=UPI002153144B|nr:uncharacterized protein LOC126513125 [Microtus fortis]